MAGDFDLTGRAAIITGGNGGIGLGMGKALARAGCAVSIWGRNPEKNRAALAAHRAPSGGGIGPLRRVPGADGDLPRLRELRSADAPARGSARRRRALRPPLRILSSITNP